MIEERNVWIGDKVSVPEGEGTVEAVETWRSKVEGMREASAREFSERCFREVGLDFRRTWGRALVSVNGKQKWWPLAAVQVIEGRDGKARNFTATAHGREGA
jgi:hypothetical protein